MVKYMLLLCGAFITLMSCNQNRTEKIWIYPQLELSPKIEEYFGTKVLDDYHQLSDLKEPKIQIWLNAQDSMAESYFLKNDLLVNYRKRFHNLQDRTVGDISLLRVSELSQYFYLRFDEVKEIDVLFFKKGLSEQEFEVYNPSIDYPENPNITYLEPSFDGNKIALGFDSKGEFTTTIIIYDLESKKVLKEIITNINPDFGGIEWLPDSSGFIYLYFPNIDPSKPNYKKESYSVIHFLGDNPDKRTPIFGMEESYKIPADNYPKVKTGSSLDKYIIAYSAKSGDFYNSFIASYKDVKMGIPNWKPFYTTKENIYYDQGEVRGKYFIYRRATPNGNEICQVDIQNVNFDSPIILAKGSGDNPITKFEVTKDFLYFIREKFGVEVSLFKINENSIETQLTLPFVPGYASFFGESITHNRIGVELDGWTSDYVRYDIDLKGNLTKEGLNKTTLFPEYENLITKQVMVVSHDGEEVPLSLVYRKDIELDSKNEVFMYVYGAYGMSMSPFFSPIFLDWAEQGGILAFPHVRGGGEKGKEWHLQGMKGVKSNSWNDLISCAEFLVENRYTKKGLIALYTNSAGGITAGMAVNERPELFSSFIAEVPRMNPFGLESSTSSSSTSYMEYGTVKDSLEFLGLLKMDPYLNLRSDTKYPATLLMPSSNDDRIPLWDNAKYIARLQRFNTAHTPIIMDINYESGHENSAGYGEERELYARVFSFAKLNMQR